MEHFRDPQYMSLLCYDSQTGVAGDVKRSFLNELGPIKTKQNTQCTHVQQFVLHCSTILSNIRTAPNMVVQQIKLIFTFSILNF